MINVLYTRIKQKYRTIKFPKDKIHLPDRFRGLPIFDEAKCLSNCKECANACPTNVLTIHENKFSIDLGKCLFCSDCQKACPNNAIHFTKDYRLSATQREDLIIDGKTLKLANALNKKMLHIFGRSLRLRQVSAGGCNGCESDVNVLNTIVFDLSRFGIQFVASPRHADGLLVTGPVTDNMKLALQKTYDAIPHPKIAIASGACAISGGPYIDHKEVNNGADSIIPINLYIPGCPPHPLTILDGLLRLLDRI